ncbi:MAG TPA: nodulation protein NfeD [Candidatus Saccharimonadales bacterium]|jgi:membrane-bound serine protease (ClpP class)|nr:nodulation protein NfeD [Candidatus Saccharimonadales bacterium]
MARTALMKTAVAVTFCLASLAARADVLKIVIDDTIHPLVSEHIQRAIHEAEQTHAEALLIELRTPGGLMDSMRDIVHDILKSPVPVIVYVTPAGSRAASAGFYILEAADVAAMAPGTNTGAAHPVLGSGMTMDPVMRDKLENDAAALLRSYASKRGHNQEVAETAVRQSKAFSADEALAQHLIHYLASSESDLLRQVDGQTVTRFDGTKTVLHLAGKPVRDFQLTLRDRTLLHLTDPNMVVFLLMLGVVAIFVEFNHPGAVVPGVVGFICLLLVAFAFQVLPVRYGALIMILSAFVLFVLEAKFQPHGAFAVGGIVVLAIGTLLLVDGPIPEMRVRWQTSAAVSIPLGLITVFLMTIAFKARRMKVTTGQEGMIGKTGVVQSPLTPAGKVYVNGEIWDAVATSGMNTGQRVVVRRIENMVLYVDPEAPAGAGS